MGNRKCRPYPRKSKSVEERFWGKVDKSGECWLWTAFKYEGYGYFCPTASIPKRAHRLSWELVNGPIPNGLLVCHTCDNRACVRPSHLFLGTQKDNLADMSRKGRGTKANRGAGSARTTLTQEDVLMIRDLASKGLSKAELGRRFNVTAGCVSRIVHYRRWKCQ